MSIQALFKRYFAELPPLSALPPIYLPPTLQRALKLKSTTVAISISSGVDSQAMLWTLVRVLQEMGSQARVLAVLADLGRFDWLETVPHARLICTAAGVPLHVVQSSNGDLLDEIDLRWQNIMASDDPDRPFWPSSSARFCTSAGKRSPIDILLRQSNGVVISAEGLRSDESASRAEKEPLGCRTKITSKPLTTQTVDDAVAFVDPHRQRVGLNWYPLHAWSKYDVWEACGTSWESLERRRALYQEDRKLEAFSGWPCARSYVRGSARHSCAICFLSGYRDIEIGVRENPTLARELARREVERGWKFRQDVSIAQMIGYDHATGRAELFDGTADAPAPVALPAPAQACAA